MSDGLAQPRFVTTGRQPLPPWGLHGRLVIRGIGGTGQPEHRFGIGVKPPQAHLVSRPQRAKQAPCVEEFEGLPRPRGGGIVRVGE